MVNGVPRQIHELLMEARAAGFRAELDKRSKVYTVRCQGGLFCLCESSLDVLEVLSRVLQRDKG